MPRKTYGLWVWVMIAMSHLKQNLAQTSSTQKNETILNGHRIAIAKFQEIPWGYACAPNHWCWGTTIGQKIQTLLKNMGVCRLQLCCQRSNLAGCHISWCVTSFQKVVPFSQRGPSYLFLLKIKTRVYVLDSLDMIPKNSRADIAQCWEKQIKDC